MINSINNRNYIQQNYSKPAQNVSFSGMFNRKKDEFVKFSMNPETKESINKAKKSAPKFLEKLSSYFKSGKVVEDFKDEAKASFEEGSEQYCKDSFSSAGDLMDIFKNVVSSDNMKESFFDNLDDIDKTMKNVSSSMFKCCTNEEQRLKQTGKEVPEVLTVIEQFLEKWSNKSVSRDIGKQDFDEMVEVLKTFSEQKEVSKTQKIFINAAMKFTKTASDYVAKTAPQEAEGLTKKEMNAFADCAKTATSVLSDEKVKDFVKKVMK